ALKIDELEFNEKKNYLEQLIEQDLKGQPILLTINDMSSPKNFCQIYTINIIIDRCAIPAVYGILRSKRHATYESFFGIVHDRIPDWFPEILMSDFEISAMDAIKQVYKTALMKYFVKTWLGCRQIWNTQPIPPLYDEELGDYGQIDQFIRNWIIAEGLQHRNALFSPPMWNMCNRLEMDLCRTNNSLESWHMNWNSHFRSGFHPKLSEVVKKIEFEETHWKLLVEEFQISPANVIRGRGQKRRAAYVEQDANLLELYNTRCERHPFEYLKSVAHRMPDPI
uniref:MULE transposase domain-containing protein n=1 Tax=Meloidogyne javanica TaxID=6303 RepID=A0A915NEN4_MELJA